MQQETESGAVPLSWYEREGGKYVQKHGVDKYPAGTYGFVNGLYVRLSAEERRTGVSQDKAAALSDSVDLASEDSFPASDPPSR